MSNKKIKYFINGNEISPPVTAKDITVSLKYSDMNKPSKENKKFRKAMKKINTP